MPVTSSHDAAGSVTLEFPGLALTYFDNSVKAVVDALSCKTNVEVVSAPKLIARDNWPATLQVGYEAPIVNQRRSVKWVSGCGSPCPISSNPTQASAAGRGAAVTCALR